MFVFVRELGRRVANTGVQQKYLARSLSTDARQGRVEINLGAEVLLFRIKAGMTTTP